jgi:hypothetical protein
MKKTRGPAPASKLTLSFQFEEGRRIAGRRGGKRRSFPGFPPVRCVLAIALLAAAFGIEACSSKTSLTGIQISPIGFTDANGVPLSTAPTSLTSGQGAYATVTVTNDPQLLGVNWSVYCGSAPPPGTPLPPGQTQDETCGTFTPAHTMSGPIPTYVTSGTGYVTFYVAPGNPPKNGMVTLYAAATSNPSKYSSVTLSINGLPISVVLAPQPPATLSAGASTQFRAVVSEDAANAGVTWTVTCASSDCGSFNPTKTASGIATTYTAPAAAPSGGTVQVTATSVTDSTKTASATISIM